jgi:tRNA-dihydrouridine synthase A
MVPYIQDQLTKFGANGKGLKLNSITRHMLGLTFGLVGARSFRQLLSDSKKLANADANLLLEAWASVQQHQIK